MKYTEEEFFGNTQNIVSENGELVPISNEPTKNTLKLGKLILSTFIKTFICVFGLMFYFAAIVVGLAPNFAIKMFDYIGAEKASLACYEQIYKKEQTLSSLYNLVQKSIENKDHSKSSKYIKELQGKNDYVDFCLKVNKAVISRLDKAYIAYLADLDGYLVNQNIIAEYETNNKAAALNCAILDLDNTNVYSFGILSYIECLENDKSLSQEQVNQKIIELVNTEAEGLKVIDKINHRRTLADVSNAGTNQEEKIMLLYTSLKIERTLYKVYDILGEQELKENARQNILSLQAEYNELIK